MNLSGNAQACVAFVCDVHGETRKCAVTNSLSGCFQTTIGFFKPKNRVKPGIFLPTIHKREKEEESTEVPFTCSCSLPPPFFLSADNGALVLSLPIPVPGPHLTFQDHPLYPNNSYQ
eukprot:767634-Hanusia_phi.AAC.3